MVPTELSTEQSAALDDIGRWLKTDEPVYRLFGAAGVGKTSIAWHIAQNMKVAFAAPTGKAAKVLRDKGCPAGTIHSLIYRPKEKSRMRLLDLQGRRDERLAESPDTNVADLDKQIAEEKRNLARPAFSLNLDSDIRNAELAIIDEVSMVDERVAEDLLSFGVKLLVLGDPYQLPPVAAKGSFISGQPNFMLTQIHRQAAESPIIRLATTIREGGKPMVDGKMVISWGSLTPEAALSFDQIIVGKNKTRKATNDRVRSLLGRTDPLPVPGDKVICLRNNRELGLYNGSIWYVKDRFGKDDIFDLTVAAEMSATEREEECVPVHRHHFLDKDAEPIQMTFWDRREAEEFDYAYAITCHKSQGSQFGSVLVFDESQLFREHANRWLYTAVTRAEHTLTLVVRR